jgi:hypothetical protein
VGRASRTIGQALQGVPQVGRRDRTICDFSFSGVNDDNAAVAPLEAMQFGRALHRLLERIVRANPRYGPVYMSKLDIADGFYRIPVRADDILKLGVLLPTCTGHGTFGRLSIDPANGLGPLATFLFRRH